MPKRPSCVTIDKRILDLSKKLGINRSQVLEKALKLEIAAKLKTFEQDIQTLEQLAEAQIIEEKSKNDQIILAGQRLEQEEFARIREKELQAEQNRKILLEFEDFCAGLNAFRPRSEHAGIRASFISYILGDVEGWRDHSDEEARLIQHFARKGLPADLNLLRPLLKKVQILVVRQR
jgi:post-segregation antitoxin (ccd killing protein)